MAGLGGALGVKKHLQCRIGLHRWSPGRYLWVWSQELGRTVRVRSKTCDYCGAIDQHVVRQRPTPTFIRQDCVSSLPRQDGHRGDNLPPTVRKRRS